MSAPVARPEPPMTRDELAAWLTLRGVRKHELEEYIAAETGKTETELDDEYARNHGDIA